MGRLVIGNVDLRDVLDVPSEVSACASKDAAAQPLDMSKDDSAKDDSADEAGSSADPEVTKAGDEFITGFGLVLTRWVEATKSATDRPQKVTPFHSVRLPSMRIKDYLLRIRQYFVCSDECYVLALIYIDRVGKIDPVMSVCSLNVHRLLLVTVMIAAKFHDDVYYSNTYYAKVGGLALKEVNALEAHLVKMLSWRMLVEPVEYQLYHSLVCKVTTEEAPTLTESHNNTPEQDAAKVVEPAPATDADRGTSAGEHVEGAAAPETEQSASQVKLTKNQAKKAQKRMQRIQAELA